MVGIVITLTYALSFYSSRTGPLVSRKGVFFGMLYFFGGAAFLYLAVARTIDLAAAGQAETGRLAIYLRTSAMALSMLLHLFSGTAIAILYLRSEGILSRASLQRAIRRLH
jgi:hypothetical protein